jgi:hypothetical protein
MSTVIENDNNRFKVIREKATVSNDTVPPTSAWPDADSFNATQASRMVLYWYAAGAPPSSIDLTLWIYDGYSDKFVKGSVTSGLVKDQLVVVPCYKTSKGAITVSGISTPSGSDFVIKAYGLRLP